MGCDLHMKKINYWIAFEGKKNRPLSFKIMMEVVFSTFFFFSITWFPSLVFSAPFSLPLLIYLVVSFSLSQLKAGSGVLIQYWHLFCICRYVMLSLYHHHYNFVSRSEIRGRCDLWSRKLTDWLLDYIYYLGLIPIKERRGTK